MKATYLLVIFSYIAFCNGLSISPNSTAKEYCVEQCRDICVPCQEDPGCKDEQRECGLGKPDPAFGGVCPPHMICEHKDYNCKWTKSLAYFCLIESLSNGNCPISK